MQINIRIKNLSLKKRNWSGLTLTKTAIKYISSFLEKDKTLKGLRINIKKSGCAGFKYVIEKIFILNINDNLVYNNMNIKLYIPLKLMSLIDGTKLDYVQEDLNYVLKFTNAQSKHTCGCGKSFSI